MCTGPKDTPYASEKFELSFHVPRGYPSQPFDVSMKQQIYHLNIEQFPKEPYHEDNKVMVQELLPENWRPHMTIFQILLSILQVLKKPDDSIEYFADNALSK